MSHDRYTPGGVECIDAMEAVAANYADPACGLLAASAVKYLWRADKKGGVEDMNKALDFVRRLRARLDGRPGIWDREG